MKKKIFALSGSTKKNASNTLILKSIAKKYYEALEVEIFDSIDCLPHFNPDLDNEKPPSEVSSFRDKIKNADAVLFCTPEYVYSLPGSLKNAIEWTVSTTVFSNKAVAFIVAAASGKKAFEALKLILTTIECRIPDESTLLIQGVKGKIKEGQINDDLLIKQIDHLVNSMIKTIEESNPMPSKYISPE